MAGMAPLAEACSLSGPGLGVARSVNTSTMQPQRARAPVAAALWSAHTSAWRQLSRSSGWRYQGPAEPVTRNTGIRGTAAVATAPHVSLESEPAVTDSSDFSSSESDLQILYNNILDVPGTRRLSDCAMGPDPNSDLQAPSQPSGTGVPVYVMLPLDTVWLVAREGRSFSVLKREQALTVALQTLYKAGVEGVMVDVWWGIAERSPGQYDFSAYRRLFDMITEAGLKVQAVMSFHAAGGNVGDTCHIKLPQWVLEVGEDNPDIFYTDKVGFRNRECLSLGCDREALFGGRTPLDLYHDFMAAFADQFQHLFGQQITEVTVGMGPAGELRYPAYPEGDGRWRFPGVGEFQCYDAYMLADLKSQADARGRPKWGCDGGPHDSGSYNSAVNDTQFFRSDGGSWDSEYGSFFLAWYSGLLEQHADAVLTAAAAALHGRDCPRSVRTVKSVLHSLVRLAQGQAVPEELSEEVLYEFEPACHLGVKLAGVHWWHKSRSHAAELTAGYYNTRHRNGYDPLLRMIARHGARVSFTCVEMRDCEHPAEARCSPQGLLEQVIASASAAGVPLSGENALQRYDHFAFDRIAESSFGHQARAGRLEQLTFLRMGDLMFDNWQAFSEFLERMRTATQSPETSAHQQQQQHPQHGYCS